MGAALRTTDFVHNVISVFADDISLGGAGGRGTSGLALKDPELVELVLGLLPAAMRREVTSLKVDKFVFLRLILTYLQNASKTFMNN